MLLCDKILAESDSTNYSSIGVKNGNTESNWDRLGQQITLRNRRNG